MHSVTHACRKLTEIRKIRREMIDWNTSRIELRKKTTKNKTARYLPMFGDMGPEIEMALSAADPGCPFLIQNEGKQVFDFEKSWKTACKAAGIPEALYHDLRRTALTNMIEAGFLRKRGNDRERSQDACRIRPISHSFVPATKGAREENGGAPVRTR
jgi:integrase